MRTDTENHKWTNIFFLFAGAFSLWVVGAWIYYHLDFFRAFVLPPETLTEHFFFYLLPLTTSILAIVCIYAAQCLQKKSFTLTIPFSWFFLIVSLLLWTLFVFFWVGYVRPTTPFHSPMLDLGSLALHMSALTATMILQFVWIGGIALAAYLAGKLCIKKIELSEAIPSLLVEMTRMGVGCFVLVVISFLAYSFGVASPLFFACIFVLLLIISWRDVRKVMRAFFAVSRKSVSLRDSQPWLVLTGLFTVVLNLLDGVQKEPAGFDAATYYLNRAQLLADHGSLVPGGLPYPFELLASIGYLFGGDASFASGLNLLVTILAALVIYSFVLWLTKKKTAASLAAITWLVLPVPQNFVFFDIKPDALAFFAAALSISLFAFWISAKKHSVLFILASFFLAFALSIKATMLFVAAATAIALLIPLISWRESWHKKGRLIGLAIFSGFLPLVLWIIHAQMHPSPDANIPVYKKIFASNHPDAPFVSREMYEKFGIDYESCSFTRFDEDFGRYQINERPLPWNLLLAPWSLTMNENRIVMAYWMNISFAFLAVFPLWLFRKFLIRNTKQSPTGRDVMRFLLFSGVAHWALWYAFAQGVVWYGAAGFFHLCIMVATTVAWLRKELKLTKVILLVLWLNIFFMLAMRLFNFASPPVFFTIAAGIQTYAGHYQGVTNVLNAPENHEKNILLTASQSIYHITSNDQRILRDTHLDIFYCLTDQNDFGETLSRLQKSNLDYILLTKGLVNIDVSTDQTLKNKIEILQRFAREELIIAYDGPEVILYEIPPSN